ncbi:MAG: LacI family DNA-binding transcriptional regulator [Alphaproteobacteria bacterium]|nr:LacI family DNA-binding transcriptional regulator [Alphaproteobacteria bacterium]
MSTATVSLAMRGNQRISAATRERVQAALTELGYVYQRSAVSLRTSMTHTVGVVLNNVSDPFFSSLLASLEDALAASGRSLFLCHTNEAVSRQTEFIRKMAEYNADGLIVSPAAGTAPTHFRTKLGGIPPTVFASRTVFELGFDYVINDDRETARIAAGRLLDLGHRRTAFVGGDPRVSCFLERFSGYREALEQASVGFDTALIRSSVPTRKAGFNAARWIAALSPRPTAAICYNGSIALGLLVGLQKEGLHPSRNFALIGHENVEEAYMTNPALSVTTVDRDEMGKRAAAALVERIRHPESPPRQIVLRTELIIRESCNFRLPSGS